MIELSSEEIDSLFDLCSSIECKRVFFRKEMLGWSYSIDIECGDTWHRTTLESDEACEIDSRNYEMDRKDVEAVRSLIESFYDRRKDA